MTQASKVLAALETGESLTAKQIAARFKVGSPRAVISQLRANGNAIYLNTHTDTKGRVTQKYRLGTPSKAMVAAAASAGFFAA